MSGSGSSATPDTQLRLIVGVAAAGCTALLAACALRRKPRNAPYAEGHWLFGNLFQLDNAAHELRLHTWLEELHKKHGKTYVLSMLGGPYMATTSDPRNVEYILKTNFPNYEKGEWFREHMYDLLGVGIFNADGEMWHSQRKTSSHMFTASQFKNHIWKVVQKNSKRLVNILKSTPKGEVVDMFNLLNRFTLDTIGEIGFGRDVGSLDDPHAVFLKSFDRAQQLMILRFTNLLWRFQRWFNVGPEKEAKEHLQKLHSYALETAQMLKEDLSGDKANSFVGMFVGEAKQHGETLDDNFLTDMVLNFLIAGRDTTAQAMSWTLYCLLNNPDAEQKVLEEMKTELGEEGLTYENNSKLRYLQNVINEGLRLYPSVPLDSKVAGSDDTLPDGTFLPRGTVVQYNPWAMGRDPDLWGKDCEEFKPERFEGKPFPSSFVYTAFNAGPRECLGKRLAWVEMRAGIAAVLRSVKLELAVPADAILPDTQLTLGMSTGLPCYVHPRD